jgi:hypothetical protein
LVAQSPNDGSRGRSSSRLRSRGAPRRSAARVSSARGRRGRRSLVARSAWERAWTRPASRRSSRSRRLTSPTMRAPLRRRSTDSTSSCRPSTPLALFLVRVLAVVGQVEADPLKCRPAPTDIIRSAI